MEVREREKAVVHGVVMHVSPVKTSRTNAKRKYFDGRIGDGKKVVRVVGFDPSLRGKLEGLREEGKAVCIANCVVKGEERNNEILINSKTTVTQSPRKFTVIADLDEVTQLTDIGNLSTGQQMTVRVLHQTCLWYSGHTSCGTSPRTCGIAPSVFHRLGGGKCKKRALCS